MSIDYGNAENHPGEDIITYPGFPTSASPTSAQRTIRIRYDSLSNRLREPETIKKVKELFPETAYSSYPNVNDFDNNPILPAELELPDGSIFSFKYNSYAELGEMCLPTGGIVQYTWEGATSSGDGFYGDGLVYRRVKTRKVYEQDGTTLLGSTQYFAATLQQQTGYRYVVSEKEYNASASVQRVTEHSFYGIPVSAGSFPPLGYPGWREGFEYGTSTANGSGVKLKSITHTWQQRGPSNTSVTPANETDRQNDPRITATSTVLGSLTSARTFIYSVDEHNNVTSDCERDFGGSSATRCVTRQFETGTAYTAATVHLRGLVKTETVTRYLPSPTTTESTVSYDYDQYSAAPLTSYDDIAGFDPERITGYSTRGNITKETRNGVVTEVTYDIAGNPITVKTPPVEGENGAVVPKTVFSYTDSYEDPPAGKKTYAFPTTITNALDQKVSRTYHWNSARIRTATDLNGRTTTYHYADGLGRLTSADLPIGRTEFEYDRINHRITTKNRLNTNESWLTQSLEYDGLGRTIKTVNAAGVATLRSYDILGRQWKVWNPGKDSNSSDYTATTYDVLNRPVTMSSPDGSVARTCYTSNETVSVDPAGKFRKYTHDSMGRLISVVEDPVVTTACQDQTNSSGANLTTTYSYNARDQLRKVDQGGQTRSFEYDGLGRLTSARNPETGLITASGTITYGYDPAGNMTARTMGGITLTQKYDPLSRVLLKTYSTATPQTPAVTYCYDGDVSRPACTSAPTGSDKNLRGRLTMVANTAATVKYGAFDALGRVTNHEVTIGSTPYTFGYEYNDLALTRETYPGGRTVGYGFDGAGRVNAVTGQYNHVDVPGYVTSVGYEPSGAMSQVNLGLVKVQNFCYNNRLQTTWIRVGTTADTACGTAGSPDLLLGLGYGTSNNGNVMSQVIQLGSTLLGTQSYQYDALNRLKTASEAKGSSGTAWSQTFVYDRYGNRAMLGSSTPAPATGVPQVTADDPAQVTALLATYTDPVTSTMVVKNQWLGSETDAAGNVKAFTSSTYPTNLTYDAENRMVSAQTSASGTMTAQYDGEGRRVKRTVNGVETVYVHDAMERLVQEYGGGTDTAAGRQYFVADHLGSTRLTLNENGVVQARSDYLPFGQEIEPGLGDRTAALGYQSKVVADADRQRMRFTGKERDAETGLDYFGARYFSGAQGRFTSPDPLDWISWQAGNDDEKRRFQEFIADPQGLNRYTYARNNPLKYIDPTGEDFELVVTFKGDLSDEEKTRILSAIRQYLTSLDIGKVIVRDAAVASDNTRTWAQAGSDLYNKDYQSVTIDSRLTSYKDAVGTIFAGDMVGRGELADLRTGDPGQWTNIIAWRALHEKIAHNLKIGSDFDQLGIADYQKGTLVGGAYGRGHSGIPALHPIDVKRVQDILRPRIRSYGR
ncbi:RHS repeat domain-containing protein [Paludibaculum fermentans]|uniref:RHS repeat domain-containing protein n=1 Tax=Paludibaculum fermentans TaxID=1473598 RepID=UPI003EBD88E3